MITIYDSADLAHILSGPIDHNLKAILLERLELLAEFSEWTLPILRTLSSWNRGIASTPLRQNWAYRLSSILWMTLATLTRRLSHLGRHAFTATATTR